MAYMQQRGFSGLGEYEHSGDWSWEFYPPPYDFLGPRRPAPMPAPVLFTPAAARGLGDGCGCSGSCGGCGKHGGLGLFESGMDLSQWGPGEWVAAAGVAYMGLAIFSKMTSGGRAARKAYRKYRRQKRTSSY